METPPRSSAVPTTIGSTTNQASFTQTMRISGAAMDSTLRTPTLLLERPAIPPAEQAAAAAILKRRRRRRRQQGPPRNTAVLAPAASPRGPAATDRGRRPRRRREPGARRIHSHQAYRLPTEEKKLLFSFSLFLPSLADGRWSC